jgi:hypothetical protein
MPTAAQRQREYRNRQREGVVIVRIAVSADMLSNLIDAGWLAAADADDREAVGAALRDMLTWWHSRYASRHGTADSG